MDKLKYNLFDLFVYSIPGSLIVSSVLLRNTGLNLCELSITQYAYYFSNVNLYSAAFFILVSYCTGFVCSLISNLLFGLLLKIKWFKLVKPDKTTLRNSEKYILVREFSPSNFSFIERWNVLANFSGSLCLSFILSGLIIRKTLLCINLIDLLVLLVVCVLLLVTAHKYKTWAIIELDNAAAVLNLGEKGKLLKPSPEEQKQGKQKD